jgi:predicted RNA-binding Zn-ribbon protein involved in translation (DUF1610 family)
VTAFHPRFSLGCTLFVYKAATVAEHLHLLNFGWRSMSKALNHCPNCGTALVAARFSRYVNERCVSNFWSCDACGHEHETAALFSHDGSHRIVDNYADF